MYKINYLGARSDDSDFNQNAAHLLWIKQNPGSQQEH